mmetsp:Transcript_24845/g.85016  ORF Transcript_24845/g.85016 Transcript_24845/m.85016 type:complete len:181 (-) Transcript_24845:264-806(-)
MAAVVCRAAAVRARRASRSSRRTAARRTAVVAQAAKGDLDSQLAEALKLAEDCKDDCAVVWDNVEELSQATANKKPVPPGNEAAKIPDEAAEFISKTAKAIADAQAATELSTATLRMLEEAAASAGTLSAETKAADPRLPELEAKLAAAIEAAKACTDDCGVAWDEVEEMSAAVSDAKKK